jgi:hypothetical protein
MEWTAEHRRLRAEADARLRENAVRLGAARVQRLLSQHREALYAPNDDASMAPGVTLFLRNYRPPHGQELRIPTLIRDIKDGQLLEELQHAESMVPGCYKLELSESGYVWAARMLHVYDRVGPGGETDDGSIMFSARGELVVRAEGHSGELWQNWSYNPDGSSVR